MMLDLSRVWRSEK